MLNTKKELMIANANKIRGIAGSNNSSCAFAINKRILELSKEEKNSLTIEENRWIEIIVEEYLKKKSLEREERYENRN